MVKFTEKTFRTLGFIVDRDGVLQTKTWFAKLIANMGVRDGKLVRIEKNRYKSL